VLARWDLEGWRLDLENKGATTFKGSLLVFFHSISLRNYRIHIFKIMILGSRGNIYIDLNYNMCRVIFSILGIVRSILVPPLAIVDPEKNPHLFSNYFFEEDYAHTHSYFYIQLGKIPIYFLTIFLGRLMHILIVIFTYNWMFLKCAQLYNKEV
jgi:hypothetical protein